MIEKTKKLVWKWDYDRGKYSWIRKENISYLWWV
jgi:hypothetical protein